MPVEGLFWAALLFFLFAVLGLCFGSFATALIYRIPRDISWIRNPAGGKGAARSACPSCHATLGFLDLIPFFSWVFLGGKCRHCRVPIPATYPLVELGTMALLLALFCAWGGRIEAAPVYLAVPFLVAALVIDWNHMILPNSLNVILTCLGLVFVGLFWHAADGDWAVVTDHLLAALLIPLLFVAVAFVISRLKKRDALGGGDVKFLIPAGLFLGMQPFPTFVALSGLLGLLLALWARGKGGDGAFPFGPALVISLLVHLFLTGLGFDYRVIY